jgi:hypothetical protein
MAKAEGYDEARDHPANPIGKEKAKPSSGIGQPIRPEAPEAPAPQSTVPAMKGVPHPDNGDGEAEPNGAIAKN